MDPMLPQPDKAPPAKHAEEYLKDEVKSARNGIGGLLLIGHTLCRTVQVFSRVPGSCGGLMLFAWIPAVGAQAYYFQGNLELHGRQDAIDFEWLILAQTVWWSTGLLMTMVGRHRVAESNRGRGVLGSFLPGWSPAAVGMISDAVVGGALTALLFGFDSPAAAGWYQMMLALLLFCHSFEYACRWLIQQRIRAAQRRAQSWRKNVRGTHYL